MKVNQYRTTFELFKSFWSYSNISNHTIVSFSFLPSNSKRKLITNVVSVYLIVDELISSTILTRRQKGIPLYFKTIDTKEFEMKR